MRFRYKITHTRDSPFDSKFNFVETHPRRRGRMETVESHARRPVTTPWIAIVSATVRRNVRLIALSRGRRSDEDKGQRR